MKVVCPKCCPSTSSASTWVPFNRMPCRDATHERLSYLYAASSHTDTRPLPGKECVSSAHKEVMLLPAPLPHT